MKATFIGDISKALLLSLFVVFTTGCYFRATINPAEEPAPSASTKSTVIEAVSGAHAYTTTPSSYRIHHSVGFKVPKQKNTTPQGYQVFNHAQGIISSEEIQ